MNYTVRRIVRLGRFDQYVKGYIQYWQTEKNRNYTMDREGTIWEIYFK